MQSSWRFQDALFLDDDSPIRLYTDASDYGIGGVLYQVVGQIWRPIAFVSKSLSSTQIKWSTMQKEAYATFHCCQQFDSLIRDRKFTIHMDHQKITFMKQSPSSMVSRWFIALQELDFKVKFVPGKDNEMADSLSRLCPNFIELAVDYTPVVMDGPVRLMAALEICPSATDKNLEWIEQCHNGMIGHGGNARTLDKLASLGHPWPFMRSHVRSFIRHCPCCQKMSAVRIPIQLHHFASST